MVSVPFPYTNRPVVQRRPALVINVIDRPGPPALLWVLMITGASHRVWPGDVPVSEPVGLSIPSIVRTAKIATVEATDATKVGRLSRPDQLGVHAHLATALGAAKPDP